MKRKFLSILLVVCMAVSALVGLTACDDEPTSATPQKLSAPVITLTDNVASWEADPNADKFEISLDGNLSYVENTVTTKALTSGQTLKVRAVGNGSTYSTSDWSNTVTYTATTLSTPQQTKLSTPAVTISGEGLASWKAVANAIDALGGVEIEILDSEIKEMNKYIPETARSIGEDPVKIEKAGVQTLNGVQAVTYSRIRKDAATGDYRRNERMKIMVAATVEKALKNPWKIFKAANASLPQIGTNMSSGEMMSAMMSFVTKDMTDNAGWPFDTSGWTAYNGAWCGVPVTLSSNVTELHEKYFGQSGYTPTQTVQDISAVISSRTGYY